MNNNIDFTKHKAIEFVSGARSSLKFRTLMFFKIPLIWFSKINVHQFNRSLCSIKLPFTRRTQNPFRSVYFAAQCMAAELSTGLILMAETLETGKKCSMLVTDMKASFTKKAATDVYFTCNPNNVIIDAIALALKNNEAVKIKLLSEGKTMEGITVANFEFEWSLKFKEE